ncbi:MAG: winged helix-turn-helix domain-containing protein [Betaproteobacteria bacterium]|nr:winged helix-turn-helix domain-containing protein [Betaproteobacteria bacterium]
MARYPGLTLRVLGKGRPAMGPGRAALLAHIARTGSISSAARAMGMSYRRAWQLVEAMNRSFAVPVVVTEVGGKRGGGAAVTPLGKRLVTLYRAMEDKASAAIAADLRRFSAYLRNPPRQRAVRRPR